MSYLLSCFLTLLLLFAQLTAAASPLPQQGQTDPAVNSTPQAQPSTESQKSTTPHFTFGLPDGTPVRLELTRDLSSANDLTGDRVDFKVVEEVKAGDIVVIPKDAIALGKIVEAQHKRRMGRGGKLNVSIDVVFLTDGEKTPLRAEKETNGKSHVGAMTGAMVASGILFFPAAPLFLFMEGKDITIPKGTQVTAYIDGDTALDISHFKAAQKPEANPAVPPQSDPAPAPASQPIN